jgi:hypothetical protein
MPSEHRGERIRVQRLVFGALRNAESATHVHLDDLVAGIAKPARRHGNAIDRGLERAEPVRQEPVADVEVDGIHVQVVLVRDGERVVDLFVEDPELRRFGSGVERRSLGRVWSARPGRACARVHADADRRARRASSPPIEL